MHTLIFCVAGLLFAGSAVAVADDLEDSYSKLQGAVAQKDAAQVKELAGKVSAMARAEAAKAAPESEDEKAAWKSRVAFAKDVDLYTEYALYSTAVQAAPATTIELWVLLEQQNPKSKYLGIGYGPYLVALNKAGQGARIPEVAEKALMQFPEDEDLQMVLAEWDLGKNKVGEAGIHAERLVTVLPRHPIPEGMAAADWERKKAQLMGRASFIAGSAHSAKNEFSLADADLRAALPRIQGSEGMLASAYFQLGVANYHLGRQGMNRAQVLEGATFSEKAAAYRGPYQQQAWTNAHLMKQEAEKMRGAK